MVGVPIGTDVPERAMEGVKDEGSDRLARCLANMPDKQAVVLIAIEPLVQRTSYLERAPDTGLSIDAYMQEGRQQGAVDDKIIELPGATEAVVFSRGVLE